MNELKIEGNLTRDAELKFTTSGKPMLRFSIAHNEKPYTKDGREEKPVSYFDVTVWGDTGEHFAWMKKGQRVKLEGILKQDRWEKDGVKHNKVYIVAFYIETEAKKESRPSMQADANSPTPDSGFSDDVPF